MRSAAVLSSSAQPIPDSGTGVTGNLPPETLQDVPTTPTSANFPLLKAVSANRGTNEEIQSVVDPTAGRASTFRIQVSAYGTSSGDYVMRAVATPSGLSACPAVSAPAVGAATTARQSRTEA